ncbi:MAG TPA: hypothetical protein VLH37_04165 [Bacteroidales bacterium]|nr:hypothetical protein [Bacteroidales bacterium]
MASIKNLKKDINYLIDEVIGTCLIHQYTQQDKTEQLNQIIDEMIEYRESMLNRVNNPDVKDNGQSLRNYYRSLFDELLEKVNGAFDQLNKLTG